MLRGPYRKIDADTSTVPIIASVSHGGVQVSDYFYKLRQKRDQNNKIQGDSRVREGENGEIEAIAMSTDRSSKKQRTVYHCHLALCLPTT